jgi:hypothetical protein
MSTYKTSPYQKKNETGISISLYSRSSYISLFILVPWEFSITIIYILQVAGSSIGPRLNVLAEMYLSFSHSPHRETLT